MQKGSLTRVGDLSEGLTVDNRRTTEICASNEGMTDLPLVSVIIPCYNQGRFLKDAIESVFNQSYPRREIIVVDDGSTDDTAQVAANYDGITLLRQENRGLPSARNAGFEASSGDHIVFLDADDKLLPHALKAGVNNLRIHPECAFVFGHYRLIADDARVMSQPTLPSGVGEPYLDLLRSNFIGMPATVMYRRDVLIESSGFDTSLPACEDYELYLRITKYHPIHGYSETIAEYRQHESNMSARLDLMLKNSLRVLGSQKNYVKGSKKASAAYSAGRQNWQEYYGKRLMKSVRLQAAERHWKRAIQEALVLIRYYPRGAAGKICSKLIKFGMRAPKRLSPRVSR